MILSLLYSASMRLFYCMMRIGEAITAALNYESKKLFCLNCKAAWLILVIVNTVFQKLKKGCDARAGTAISICDS